jgi:DNA-binding IclR family transcriptional regulator
MGLRRAPGLHVRQAEGRAFVAQQPDGHWDAVVIDAFLGARVPRRLVSAEALADVARVARRALVNVVDDRAQREVHAVAAGLATVYPEVWMLGGRVGNTIVVGGPATLAGERILAAAAADPSPARLTSPSAVQRLIAGTPPWRDRDLTDL